MKKFVFSLLLSVLASVAAFAYEEPVVIADYTVHGQVERPRAPAFIPIKCFVDSEALYVRLETAYDLGSIEVSLVNEESGDIQSTTLLFSAGSHYLPFTIQDGIYSIYFTILDGCQYKGIFMI